MKIGLESNLIRALLKNVYFITGTAYAGKSTMVRLLAENGDTFLLLVGEAKDGWYQIQYEGKTAYVSEDYVTVKEVSVEEAAKLRGEGGSSESSSEGSSSEESSDAPDSKAPESSATTAPGVSRDSEDGEA